MTSQINIHRVSEPTGPVLASCPHRNTDFLIILSPIPPVQCWSCDNSNIHTTGLQSLPVRYWATVALIYTHTHRFPHYFVTNSHRSGSCDNADTGAPVGPVPATVAHIDFPTNFVIKSHRSGAGHACQNKYTPGAIPVSPVPDTFFCYFVTNSHHSGAGYVTTYQHTQCTRPYWYGTGYRCPVT